MNVVCIIREKGGFIYGLTIGKWYEAEVDSHSRFVEICNDLDVCTAYLAYKFKTVHVVREEALNKLGI